MKVNKPLTYLSLKYVLKYTDPNIRLQLASVCPGFSYTEKLVPLLKIDQLIIKPTSLTINDTNYTLGVIRHYPEVKAPKWVQEMNAAGAEVIQTDTNAEPLSNPSKFEIVAKKKKLEEEANMLRNRIRSYNKQLSLSSLKFEHYLQLTITSKSGTKFFERMVYDRTLKESMDYFIRKFLLGSRENLDVDTVQIDYIPEIPSSDRST
ncbi:hypothetical protein CRE_14569 [Caenorhabditis remanei]|uniref:Uncharacterized protein n=1 Tax=Caenorhabditis remanei TaxID=31234 RepID=E3M9K3_CAERE|nr:hypothetical protein CRE_14569 [Caenorhabditis remanei]